MTTRRTAEEWATHIEQRRPAVRALQEAMRKNREAGRTLAGGIVRGDVPEAGPQTRAFVREFGRYGDGR